MRRHPGKPILRLSERQGATSFCPPCLIADTSFDEGAGVIIIPGGTSPKFRTLLQVVDKPPRVERGAGENSPMVRCERKVQCGVKSTDVDPSYNLVIEGPINVATQLLAPRKGDVIFAVVAWRTSKEITLLAFAPAPSDSETLTILKTFFKEETQHYKAESVDLGMETEVTPIRRKKAAEEASGKTATPEPWGKRKRTESS